jgi:CBS domain-containing protein
MFNPNREKRLLDITGAEDLEQLRLVREKEQDRLVTELSSSPVNAVVESLNELHDDLIAQALKLAENDLARLGLGAPPVLYTYLLFGSGGRYEQTMYSDQDSGIVFENASNEVDDEHCNTYFTRLADTVVQHLIALGYPPCEGNVISSNPEWCLSLHDWGKKIDGWFAEPSWENVRYLLIAADGRPVAGSLEIARNWQDRFFNDMLSHPVIARRMMENTLRHKMLVGVFGQLLTERYGEDAGSLDIKYGAYIPMVNAFRLLAVQAGIRETSTLKRIQALQQAGLLSPEEAEEAYDAFSYFLRMRLLTTVTSEEGQLIGTGKIPAEQLTREMTVSLKKALKAGKKIQLRVQRELQRRFGGR